MNVGLIAPGVEAHTVRERLTADWHLLDMWNEREIQARAAECAVFPVAPGKARSSVIQERLLLLEAQDTDSSVPTVCYAALEPDDPLIKVVGSGRRVCTLVHRGTEDGFLQEEILEAAVRPFFWHLSRTIAGIDDLDPILCEFLAALVAQPVPRFDRALAMDGARIPPFVRKLKDAPRLAWDSLSLIRERAREGDRAECVLPAQRPSGWRYPLSARSRPPVPTCPPPGLQSSGLDDEPSGGWESRRSERL